MALDLFLDDEDSNTNEHQSSRPAAIFQSIKSVLNETLVKNIGGVFEFNLTGKMNKITGTLYIKFIPSKHMIDNLLLNHPN